MTKQQIKQIVKEELQKEVKYQEAGELSALLKPVHTLSASIGDIRKLFDRVSNQSPMHEELISRFEDIERAWTRFMRHLNQNYGI